MDSKLKALLELFIIAVIFIVLTYVVQSNIEFFEMSIGKNVYGILVYLLVIVIAMVVAPISSIPLIPLISNTWGWKVTGALNLIGWTLGGVVVFFICRRWGLELLVS